MRDIINFNQKYGKLTILKEIERIKGNHLILECMCDCGVKINYRWQDLKMGLRKSCGCIKKSKKGLSHTDCGKLLSSMIFRCKENSSRKKSYFDKGITVCDEWVNDIETFIDFCNKNGYKKGLQIDRIDNSKGYYPENCRFVTLKENANNKDTTCYIEYKGHRKPLSIVLRELGRMKHRRTIFGRVKKGMSFEDAINKPIKVFKKKIVD